MKKKGLCSNCSNYGNCIFLKEPPVLQCEEYTFLQPKAAKEKRARR